MARDSDFQVRPGRICSSHAQRTKPFIAQALASGRFAVIDDGLGFQLVPWSPSLEKRLGRHVSGVARDDGGIEWDFG